jgi:hypothetical protein
VAEHYPGEDPQKFVSRNLLDMSSTPGKGGRLSSEPQITAI